MLSRQILRHRTSSVDRSTDAGKKLGRHLAEEHFGVHEQHEVHNAPCHSRVDIARAGREENDLPGNDFVGGSLCMLVA